MIRKEQMVPLAKDQIPTFVGRSGAGWLPRRS